MNNISVGEGLDYLIDEDQKPEFDQAQQSKEEVFDEDPMNLEDIE